MGCHNRTTPITEQTVPILFLLIYLSRSSLSLSPEEESQQCIQIQMLRFGKPSRDSNASINRYWDIYFYVFSTRYSLYVSIHCICMFLCTSMCLYTSDIKFRLFFSCFRCANSWNLIEVFVSRGIDSRDCVSSAFFYPCFLLLIEVRFDLETI